MINESSPIGFKNDQIIEDQIESDPIFTAWLATVSPSNWNTAYGWGNHASAGYLTSATAGTTYSKLNRSNKLGITSLTRSSNLIATVLLSDGRTLTVTRSSGLISSITDGTTTWSITRSGNYLSALTVV